MTSNDENENRKQHKIFHNSATMNVQLMTRTQSMNVHT